MTSCQETTNADRKARLGECAHARLADGTWTFPPACAVAETTGTCTAGLSGDHLRTAQRTMHALLFCICVTLAWSGNADEFGTSNLYPESQFIDLIARDIESFQGPMAFGHKYITGGAGEGDQQLRAEDDFEHRQQVKSDNVLPAYCEPPNPCPVGYTATDGCLEEFENSAEFSRNYQAQQQCLCDHEHMFNCPANTETNDFENELDDIMAKNGLHKGMIAKKFHEKRSDFEEPRRKKRSAGFAHFKPNPYLQGEPLRSVAKKDGRHL